MPVRPRFEWSQTDDAIIVSVLLRGVPAKDVNVFVSDVCVKVNFAPYLLLLDLAEAVEDDKAEARFSDGSLELRLPKARRGAAWAMLECDGLGKEERKARREASVRAREERDRAAQEAAQARRREEKDVAFKQQMALEEAQRAELEQRKQSTKKHAEEEMYAALARAEAEHRSVVEASTGSTGSTGSAASAAPAGSTASAVRDKAIFADDADADEAEDHDDEEEEEDAKEEREKKRVEAELARVVGVGGTDEGLKYVPPPRSGVGTKVSMHFTERHWPTPMRASRAKEEADWLARNKHIIEARRRAEAAARGETAQPAWGSSVEERDPAWLKAKGDEFMRAGDFAAASNAYTAAVMLDPTQLGCILNRAAARLRLGHADAAARDCSTALLLLPTPPVTAAPSLPPYRPRSTLPPPSTAPTPSSALTTSTSTSSSSSSSSSSSTQSPPPATPEALADETASREAAALWDTVQRLLTSSPSPSPSSLDATSSGAAASLTPPGPLTSGSPRGERAALLRALARRAGAFCHAGEFLRAAVDFRAAASVAETMPGDEPGEEDPRTASAALQKDAERMDELGRVEAKKAEGDEILRQAQPSAEQLARAVAAYSEALATEPRFVPALVNRAAAQALLQRLQLCIDDCSRALLCLGVERPAPLPQPVSIVEGLRAAPACDFVPAPGSVRVRSWALAALLRRAAAKCKLGLLREALEDYRRSLELDPLSKKIETDMQRITGRLLLQRDESAGGLEGGEVGGGGHEGHASEGHASEGHASEGHVSGAPEHHRSASAAATAATAAPNPVDDVERNLAAMQAVRAHGRDE